MIECRNGLKFRFIVSSGARGWAGRDEGHGLAHLWKAPWRWLGLMNTGRDVPVTIKTLTLEPRRGNYRGWCPWRSIRPVPGGVVNAVGLSNPGLPAWIGRYGWMLEDRPEPFVLSLAPADAREVRSMMALLKRCGLAAVKAVEINPLCPNVAHDPGRVVEHVCELVTAVLARTELPVILKLGVHDPYQEICRRLDGSGLAAFHLINSVPWTRRYPGLVSPLTRYGYHGSVSGWPIAQAARTALLVARQELHLNTPIISGGGVMDAEEARWRLDHGADAVALGSIFLRAPWRARQIIKELS